MERAGELEDKLIEIIQSEEERENTLEKIKRSSVIYRIIINNKRSYICVIGIWGEEYSTENIFGK